MMTREEEINKAAYGYAEENLCYPGEISYESDIMAMQESFADSFKAGAEWRINTVWHDVDKEPKQKSWFIAQIGNDCFDTFTMAVESDRWKRWCKGMNIKRWAYIDDLLPEGGAQ